MEQRLAAWRRLSRWDAARRCPAWRGQPGAGDGGRDETYCSYLEHAPLSAAASKKTQEKQRQPNWSTPANLSKAIRSGTASAAVWGLRFQAGSELRCDCQFGKLPIPSKIWRRCISVATAAATSKWV